MKTYILAFFTTVLLSQMSFAHPQDNSQLSEIGNRTSFNLLKDLNFTAGSFGAIGQNRVLEDRQILPDTYRTIRCNIEVSNKASIDRVVRKNQILRVKEITVEEMDDNRSDFNINARITTITFHNSLIYVTCLKNLYGKERFQPSQVTLGEFKKMLGDTLQIEDFGTIEIR